MTHRISIGVKDKRLGKGEQTISLSPALTPKRRKEFGKVRAKGFTPTKTEVERAIRMEIKGRKVKPVKTKAPKRPLMPKRAK